MKDACMVSEEQKRRTSQRTLAEFFCYFRSPKARAELEEFRCLYEATHPQASLTTRWTSTMDRADQDWLLKNHPKRYWDGLPPFVQEFVLEKIKNNQFEGKLDDTPDALLRLYMRGEMTTRDHRSL